MALIFMKVAPYGYKNRTKDLNYYADLAAQRISPPLLPEARNYILRHVKRRDLKKVKLIRCSPQKRAVQTAKILQQYFLTKVPVKIDKNLDEVPFALDGLNPETYSSTKARTKFLTDFVKNRLPESRDGIKSLIRRILKTAEGKNVLCVTHTFLMKIIETLVKFPFLFEQPQKLKRNFDTENRLFEYCEMLNLDDKKIREVLNKLN